MGNTGRGGLGGVSIAVPHSGLIIMAKLSKDKGSALTFSAVCTRNREHCIRSLSTCTERFLNRVSGPSIRDVSKLSPTVSVSRGAADGGPHSAINAMARVCSCVELLFTEVNVPRYPGYKGRVGSRSVSRVISTITILPRQAGLRILTPMVENEGNRRGGIIGSTFGGNFTETVVSNRVVRLSNRSARLSGRGGRAVRVIISHLTIGRKVREHLASSIRATLGVTRNVIRVSMVSKREVIFDAGCTYSSYNVDVRRLAPEVFSFGAPCNTYPGYVKVNSLAVISPSGIVPSGAGSVGRNTVTTAN